MDHHAARFLVFLVMYDVIPSASSTFTFVSEPSLTRRYVGDDATMEWTLSSDRGDFFDSSFFNENDVRIFRHTQQRVGQTTSVAYVGRMWFYSTSPRGVGFTLTHVTLRDAGQYRCRYHAFPDRIDSSPSVLFIFDEPSTPVISLRQYGQISDPFTGDLKEGDGVSLLCAASSTSLPAADRPAMTYTWTRNGQPIDRDNPPDRHSVFPSTGRRLDISPASRDDVTYGCTAQEEGSTLNSQATRNLNVLYPPGAATAPDPPPSPVVQGAFLIITCFLSDPGNPPARVVYRSPKGQFPTTTSNTLVIRAVTLDRDDGTWDCYGINTAGTARQATFDINVHVPTRVVQDLPATKTMAITEELSVSCCFEGRPQPAIQLTYGGSAVLPVAVETVSGEATGNKLMTSSSWLRWKTSSTDSQRRLAGGVYRCNATNTAGTVTSQEMTLDAQYAPYDVLVTPSSSVTTVEGEPLVLEGRADCNPPCQYSWTLNGDSLIQDTSGRLQIDRISRDQHGTYSVRYYNDLGSLTENVVVSVNYHPTVSMTIDPEDGSRGDRVKILCEVDSRPHSQVTWANVTNSGSPQGTLSDREQQHHLTLDPVDCLDSGTIRCTADNGVTPTASTQRDLNVFCPPRLDPTEPPTYRQNVRLGENVTFLVYVIANPAPVSWTYTLTTKDGSTHDNNVNGVTLSPSGNYGTLTIASVQPHHYGYYDVTVTNAKVQQLVIQLRLEKTGDNAATIAAVTATVIVVIIVIVVVIVVIVLRRKRRVSKRDATPLYENTACPKDRSATDAVQLKSTETGAATEFEENQVEIQNLLSDGTGFQVYSAQVQIGLSLHAAIIKRVKDAVSHEVYSRYLAYQMSVMLNLKHVNIVKLLGFQRGSDGEYENASSMSFTSLVLAPATQGDLHTFLTGHGAGFYQKTATMEIMMGMALGVATGALALSKVKPAVLHHYICAKHVLVDDRGVCKLTGFSSAEAVRAREAWEVIHKWERPIRWMSAETLDHLEHTTKSDVWSSAIFLWELFSLGEMPYPGLEDDEVQRAIQDRHRLEKPNNCDPIIYDLMIECWIPNTEKRPDFEYVVKCLMNWEKTHASAMASDEHTYEAVV